MKEKVPAEKCDFQVSDKRFWIEDTEAIEKATPSEPRYPSFVEELKGRTELAEQRLRERLEKLDQENAAYRKRLSREFDRRVEREKADLLRGLLEVADNMERALDAASDSASIDDLREGLRLNLSLLLSRFNAAGVEPIDILDAPFDPNEAEAVGVIEVDKPERDQMVVTISSKGYRLGEQILRPAMVIVGQYRDKTDS